MKPRTLQLALAVSVAFCVLLAAALIYVLTPRGHALQNTALEDPVVARGPDPTSQPMASNAAPEPGVEPALTAVQLSPQRLQEIGVTTATAELKNVNDDLSVSGNVDIDEERISFVQTRFAGWIQNVFANATYQYVRKGQRLFTVYSPDLVSSEQEYILARKNQTAFSQDAHGMAVRESGWLLEAAEERLQQFGVPAQQISDLEQSGKVQHDVVIDSPVSGYIIERNALPNAYIQPDTKLYTIADLSTVWVNANVSQGDVGRLKPGDRAKVTVDAYPGRIFNARIDQILPQVDQATRTVRVRLVLRNPGVALKPGMYVNVEIAVSLGRQLVIPASAVLQTGERAIAFINHGNGSLEPRTIETGSQLDGSVVVLKGLNAGDQVISSANFLVDSEAQLQSALGSSTLPPPLAGAAPTSQIQIDVSTQPSPPRKGPNLVRVNLKGHDGKPASGMQVSVTFFMPAMPAMGMAAERAVATLADKGNGLYEGPLQLPAGGAWQVIVAVQRGAQALATRQLSLNAAGGM